MYYYIINKYKTYQGAQWDKRKIYKMKGGESVYWAFKRWIAEGIKYFKKHLVLQALMATEKMLFKENVQKKLKYLMLSGRFVDC